MAMPFHSAESRGIDSTQSRRGPSVGPRQRGRGTRGPSSWSRNSSSSSQEQGTGRSSRSAESHGTLLAQHGPDPSLNHSRRGAGNAVPSTRSTDFSSAQEQGMGRSSRSAESHGTHLAQLGPDPSLNHCRGGAGNAVPSTRTTDSSSAQEQAPGPSRRKRSKREDKVPKIEGPCKVLIYMTPLEVRVATSPTVDRGDNPLPLGMQHWTVVFVWEDRAFRVGGVTEKGECTIVGRLLTTEEALDQPGEKVECGEKELSLATVRSVVKKMTSKEFTSTPEVAKTLLAKLGIELPVEGILFVAFKGLFDVFNFLVSKERRNSSGPPELRRRRSDASADA